MRISSFVSSAVSVAMIAAISFVAVTLVQNAHASECEAKALIQKNRDQVAPIFHSFVQFRFKNFPREAVEYLPHYILEGLELKGANLQPSSRATPELPVFELLAEIPIENRGVQVVPTTFVPLHFPSGRINPFAFDLLRRTIAAMAVEQALQGKYYLIIPAQMGAIDGKPGLIGREEMVAPTLYDQVAIQKMIQLKSVSESAIRYKQLFSALIGLGESPLKRYYKWQHPKLGIDRFVVAGVDNSFPVVTVPMELPEKPLPDYDRKAIEQMVQRLEPLFSRILTPLENDQFQKRIAAVLAHDNEMHAKKAKQDELEKEKSAKDKSSPAKKGWSIRSLLGSKIN